MRSTKRSEVSALLAGALLLFSCGGGETEPGPPLGAAREQTARTRGGDESAAPRGDLDPCSILREVEVAGLLGIDEGTVSYREIPGAHPGCTASRQAGEPADEAGAAPGPAPRAELVLTRFDFPDASGAVAALEELVEAMEQPIDTEVRGKQVTFRGAYDEWVEGVGDRAAWSSTTSQLSVAAKGRLFHVAVEGTDEPAEDRRLAIELARRIAERL